MSATDMFSDEKRTELERRWLALTRETLPRLAADRSWPVREDHCLQRVLLDAVCGRRWYDEVKGRPAYRHIRSDRLAAAVRLAEAVAANEADLKLLNQQSLGWRRLAPSQTHEGEAI